MAGEQAGEVHGIFQNGEVVQEKLKVSGEDGPGELWHRNTRVSRKKQEYENLEPIPARGHCQTGSEGESASSLNPQPDHPEYQLQVCRTA